MSNNTSHTANFLVSLFSSSKYSLKYLETAIHYSILRYIADAIDHEFRISRINIARISRKQIALYARCSIESVKLTIQHFISKRILKVKHNPGSCSQYSPGILLIAYAQKNIKLSTGRVKSRHRSGNQYPTSNISSNSKDNNNAEFEKMDLDDKEKNKIALRKLGDKLGKASNH